MKSRLFKAIGCFAGITIILLAMHGSIQAQEMIPFEKVDCKIWHGQPISGIQGFECISTDGQIKAIYPDSANAIIYILVQNMKRDKIQRSGFLVAFNLRRHMEMWNTPFDFIEERFFLADSIPVISGENNARGLKRANGTVAWTLQGSIGMVTASGVGVAKLEEGWEETVLGIDLHNGKEIWRKHADFEDIKTFEIHGDTAVVFLRGGLNYINLNTGKGFYVEAKTLEKYRTFRAANSGGAAAAGMLGGLVGGLIFGVVMASVPASSGRIKQRSANSFNDVYLDKTGLYFTSKKRFYKVSYSGEVIWQRPVDKSIGPIRKIFVVGSKAFMISKGMVVIEDMKRFSDAELFQINRNGSGVLRQVHLNTAKRSYVQDFLVKDSSIVVALNNRLVEIELDDLSTIREKLFGRASQNSGFGDILNPPAIVYTDSLFEMESDKHPDDFFVANRNGMKIRFSADLEPAEVIRENDYFQILRELNRDRLLVSNGDDVFLINADGQKVINQPFSSAVKYNGGRLFDFGGNKLIIWEVKVE